MASSAKKQMSEDRCVFMYAEVDNAMRRILEAERSGNNYAFPKHHPHITFCRLFNKPTLGKAGK